MATRDRDRLVAVLLDRYGTTYAEELGIPLRRGTPSALFRLLCASVLYSHRIGAHVASSAAKALAEAGWTTATRMAASTWEERTRVLNRSGFARYDESTSRMLGEDAALLLERYGGDLRRLREAAGRDPAREGRLLQEFKGIGPVGADIFRREVQVTWPELRPFVDRRAAQAAERLGLPSRPDELAGLVADDDVARLVAALVRVDLDDGYVNVEEAAAGAR